MVGARAAECFVAGDDGGVECVYAVYAGGEERGGVLCCEVCDGGGGGAVFSGYVRRKTCEGGGFKGRGFADDFVV